MDEKDDTLKKEDNKSLIPQGMFYLIAALVSYFFSDKIKIEYGLTTPEVVVLMEVYSIIVVVSIYWFIIFREKTRAKKWLFKRLKRILIIFIVFSVLFSVFISKVFVQIQSDKVQTYLVGMHDNNGKWVTDHQSVMKDSAFIPELAYSDLSTIKNILLYSTLFYLLIATSLFCIVIEISGWKAPAIGK